MESVEKNVERSVEQNLEQTGSARALRAQLGEYLQRARLVQQKDSADVARRLMLSKLQLSAIETGQAESFHHERRYIQAIKSYVLYLNLDNDPLVSDLLKQIEGFAVAGMGASPAAGVAQLHLSASTPTRARTYSARRPKFIYISIGLLIVGAIALAISEGWPFKDGGDQVASTQPGQVDAQSEAITSQTGKTDSAATTSVVVMPPTSIAGGSSAPLPQASSGLSVQSATTTSTGSATVPGSAPASTPASTPGAGASSQSALPTPASPTAAAAKNAQSVAAGGPSLMRIDFNADCWVSLQTSDGKKEERIYKQGQHLEVPASNVTGLILGNAPAAKMTLGSRPVDIMAKNLTQGNITRLDQKNLQALQKN